MKDNGGRHAPIPSPSPGYSTDLALLALAVIWGGNFPFIKATLAEIPPLAFNALRFPLASLTVFVAMRWSGRISWPEPSDRLRIVALGILGNLVYQGFFILGIDSTLAGNTAILMATVPIWTISLSTLRGHEHPGPLVWTGILVTLSGIVLVVAGGEGGISLAASTLRGDVLIVGAAIVWSTYTVGSRRMIQKYGSLEVAAWTLWVGTAGLVVLGAPSLSTLSLTGISPKAWAGICYAGILAIGLAYMIWNHGVKKIGSSRTAAYQNLTPIVALGVAWLWLGEAPGGMEMWGAAMVLAGVTLAQLRRRR